MFVLKRTYANQRSVRRCEKYKSTTHGHTGTWKSEVFLRVVACRRISWVHVCVGCGCSAGSQATGHGSFFPIGKNRHLPISGRPGIAVEERCSATKCRSESFIELLSEVHRRVISSPARYPFGWGRPAAWARKSEIAGTPGARRWRSVATTIFKCHRLPPILMLVA
jgi:hypothetical protein